MSDFPDSVYTPRTIANREGVVYDSAKTKVFFAEDVNNSNDEIVAIEEILGLNPEGDFTSVVDRLDDIDDQLDDLEVTDGWKPSSVQPTLIDSDDPVFTLRFGANMTGILTEGMRLKITQDSDVCYFIIVAVGAYESSNTDILVYGGTDYNITDTSTKPITLCKYSGEKCPFGFPLDPDSWTVEVKDTSVQSQSSPASGTWYNPGSVSIDVPVGCWELSYETIIKSTKTVNQYLGVSCTLSTDDADETDSELSAQIRATFDSGFTGTLSYQAEVSRKKIISLTTETTYYMNIRTNLGNIATISFENASNGSDQIIRAVCAYL